MKMLYAVVLIISAFALGCLLAHWKAYGFSPVDLKVWAVCTVALLAIVGLGSLIHSHGPYSPRGYTKVDIPGGHLYVRNDQRVERHDGFVRVTNMPATDVANTDTASAVTSCDGGAC